MKSTILKKFLQKLILLIALMFIMTSCNHKSQIKIISHSTGLIGANCYLVYDPFTKEAALIDIGGEIDTLVNIIYHHKLKLKYILITHGHQDHIVGVPPIQARYPDAKLGMSEQEFIDLERYANFQESFPNYAEAWLKDSAMSQLMNFDFDNLGTPDLFLSQNSALKLGKFRLQILDTPGHSRGSVSFMIGDALFTGDILLKGTVGMLDYKLASRMDLINSVYSLYNNLPESIIIYPGHRQPTTLKIEKYSNNDININKLNI